MKHFLAFILRALVPGCALLLVACTKEARVGRLTKDADAHFTGGEFDSAEIEYKNVLTSDRNNAHAFARLGVLYYEQGRHLRAISYLNKALELNPNLVEAKLKLGALFAASGRFKDAREAAIFVLQKKPDDPEAPALLAESSVQPAELEDARQRLGQLPGGRADAPATLTALAILDLRQRKVEAAEAALNRALRADPKFAAAHSVLAVIHVFRRDSPKAEAEYKAAAELSPVRSSKRIQYAKFKAQNNDLPAARSILEEITKAAPDYLPAWMTLAEFAHGARNYDESLGHLGKILARESAHLDALLLRANVYLAKGEGDKAVAELERMTANFPQSPLIIYQLGLAYQATGNAPKAAASFNQAVTLAPNYADAILAQAALAIRRSEITPALIASLKKLIQQRPDLLQAQLSLADAYRGQGKLDDALTVYAEVEKKFPRLPQTALQSGLILLRQGKRAEARQAFEKAVEIAPNLVVAVEQLVGLDLADKRPDDARRRVEALVSKYPTAAEPYVLLSRVMMTLKDQQLAEMALQKAIAVQPDAPVAYQMLARLQLANNEPGKAISNLERILERNPRQADALMLLSAIYQQQKKYPEARDTYEKLIEVNPRFGPAFNNLAYLYSEHFNQVDRALDFAQKARQLLPLDPNTADTLGWILYQKRQYSAALPLLQESADKLGDSPDVHYHLGMTQYMLGDETAAVASLKRALDLGGDFAGHEDARRRLAFLTGQGGGQDRVELERFAAEKKNDPLLLARLGAAYEREKSFSKAKATYESALALSPNSVALQLGLARSLDALQDNARALDVAKNARKTAPDDPAVAHVLGRLAYETGSHAWGYSLLQEAARRTSDDPELWYDSGRAAFSVGKLTEAETSLRRALDLQPNFSHAPQARQLLDLHKIALNPTPAAESQVAAILKASPKDPAGLLAAAAIQESKKEYAAAQKAYEAILSTSPDQAMARKRLALLYARSADGDVKKALEFATKARETYPDDAELSKTLGIIFYRQNNFSRAASLLRESAGKRETDAEIFYYLGLVRHQLKETNEAKKNLQSALDLNLSADLAAHARKILAELK